MAITVGTVGALEKHFTVGDCRIRSYLFNAVVHMLFLLSASWRQARNETIKEIEGIAFITFRFFSNLNAAHEDSSEIFC